MQIMHMLKYRLIPHFYIVKMGFTGPYTDCSYFHFFTLSSRKNCTLHIFVMEYTIFKDLCDSVLQSPMYFFFSNTGPRMHFIVNFTYIS